MYDYLPPDSMERERHIPQKSAGMTIIYNTEAVYWAVLHWWHLCSLDENCIAPKGHKRDCSGFSKCIQNGTATCWHGCHRYDQSAINILYNAYLHGHFPELLDTPVIHPLPFTVMRRKTKMFLVKKCV